MSALEDALQIMRDVTPLKTDCGVLCGCACCHGEQDDGMILLPHESARYREADWCRVIRRDGMDVLVCCGSCPRDMRPFSCMLFPLRISVKDSGARIVMDPLAVPVCPLTDHGLRALDSAFLSAAKRSAGVLLKDPEYLSFFREQTKRMETGLDSPLFTL